MHLKIPFKHLKYLSSIFGLTERVRLNNIFVKRLLSKNDMKYGSAFCIFIKTFSLATGFNYEEKGIEQFFHYIHWGN